MIVECEKCKIMKTKLTDVLSFLEACSNLQMSQDEIAKFVKNLLAIFDDEKSGE